MKRLLRSSLLLVAAGGAAAAVAVLAGADRDDLVVDGVLVFLAGVAALTAARFAASAFPAPRNVVPRTLSARPAAVVKPEALGRIEDVVALAEADDLEFHVRLRPVLTDIAAAAYAVSGAGDGAQLPLSAETAFTRSTWELVRPDRERPGSGREGQIGRAGLEAVVRELESMLPR